MEYQCNEKHDGRLARLRGTPLHTAVPQSVLLKGWGAAGDPMVRKGVGGAKEERMPCSRFSVKHFHFYG